MNHWLFALFPEPKAKPELPKSMDLQYHKSSKFPHEKSHLDYHDGMNNVTLGAVNKRERTEHNQSLSWRRSWRVWFQLVKRAIWGKGSIFVELLCCLELNCDDDNLTPKNTVITEKNHWDTGGNFNSYIGKEENIDREDMEMRIFIAILMTTSLFCLQQPAVFAPPGHGKPTFVYETSVTQNFWCAG